MAMTILSHTLLQAFMARGSLCDVTITAGEVTLPCHRLILAANSDYFAAMFTGQSPMSVSMSLLYSTIIGVAGGMAEQNMETVEIQGVESGALRMLVDYCYTGK